MQCLLDHIVLNVEDDEKMIVFYSKVLMLAPRRMPRRRDAVSLSAVEFGYDYRPVSEKDLQKSAPHWTGP